MGIFRADAGLADTYLVALSGYALPDDLDRAREAGFERHVAMPPDPEKLEELLANLPRERALSGAPNRRACGRITGT